MGVEADSRRAKKIDKLVKMTLLNNKKGAKKCTDVILFC